MARAMVKRCCITLLMMMAVTTVVAQRVASGGRHSLAICADGSVATWGFNGHGQRGNGTVTESAQSTRVDGLTSVRAVAGGLFHSLFLMADSTVRACGRNTPRVNSTTGHTTLRFSRPLNHARVTVYDAFGNSVLQHDGINGSSAVLELTDRAAGAYQVTVADGNGAHWTTMVIFLP